MSEDYEVQLENYYKDTVYAMYIRDYVSAMYPKKVSQFSDDMLLEAVRIAIDEYDSLYDTMTASVRNDKGLYFTTCSMYKELAHQAIKDYCDSQLMDETCESTGHIDKGFYV